jgi:hypothetical protein
MCMKIPNWGGAASALAFGLLLAAPVSAAAPGGGVFAYPKAGQSQEQQSKDQNECHQWAAQQSGFDPAAPAPQPMLSQQAPPPPSSGGGMVRGAGRGAAMGAIGGAIFGDAGKGAAAGAAMGALGGTMRRLDQQREQAAWQYQQQQQLQQQQQQLAAERAAGEDNYRRAYSACMTGRNYQVQ